jgi:hypothetical protein
MTMNNPEPPKPDALGTEERLPDVRGTLLKPKRPRFRFQFSLRTLLIVVLVLGVVFGWIGSRLQRARDNRQTIAKIRSLGGAPTLVPDFCGPADGPSWLEELFHDPGVVRGVAGVGPAASGHPVEFGDAGLEYVKELTGLRALILNKTQVTDAGLEHLKELTDLRFLDLTSNTQITDLGLEHLEELTSLEWLNLSETQVTDAGLEHLKELANLREL